MSVLKQNPFLAGFGAVMVLGVGALGYLTYSAADAHSTAATDYEEKQRELSRLQGLKPYPHQESLAKYAEQKKAFQAKVTALQEKLAASKIKVEDISPTEFQNKLRDTVAKVAARAAESNVKFPDAEKQKFYLGFNVYQGEPPKAAAAPRLYRDLKAIESVLNIILETKNVTIKELKRDQIAEEKDVKPATQPQDKNKKGGGKSESDNSIVQKDSFTITFSTTQENIQRILSGIVANKEQFFIPRYVMVKNETPEPPPKIAAVVPPPPPPPVGGTPTNQGGTPPPPPPEQPQLQYIFGRETVEATLDLEIVDVAAPAAPDAGKTANNRN